MLLFERVYLVHTEKCMFLIWDVDELGDVGLPHEDQDIVLVAVKYYLPVRLLAG